MTAPEKIDDTSSSDVKRYGMIVRQKGRQGLLLPDLENIKSVDQQLNVCLKKGGIKESDPYELFRLQVKRFHQRDAGSNEP